MLLRLNVSSDAPEDAKEQNQCLQTSCYREFTHCGDTRTRGTHAYLFLKKKRSPRRVVTASRTRLGSQASGVTGAVGSGLLGLDGLSGLEPGFIFKRTEETDHL